MLSFSSFRSFIWIFIFFLVQCSTWKKSNLGMEASWYNDQDFLVYSIEFEETNSWNPMDGTTHKRNFNSLFREYQLREGSQIQKISEFQLPFWVLNNNVFYHSDSKTIFMMRGTQEGYGTENRIISQYFIDEKKILDLWTPKPEEFLWKFLPSPNTNQIALITTKSSTSELGARLHIWDKTKGYRSIDIPAWIDSSFEYGIAWNPDSSILFLALNNIVYSVNPNTEKMKLQKTNRFPKCFVPSTNFGFRISPNGHFIEIDPSQPNQLKINQDKNFEDYSKIPKTNTYQNSNCQFSF
jgi:hypothetical protein